MSGNLQTAASSNKIARQLSGCLQNQRMNHGDYKVTAIHGEFHLLFSISLYRCGSESGRGFVIRKKGNVIITVRYHSIGMHIIEIFFRAFLCMYSHGSKDCV
jgi:hypothetical protein